MVTTAFLVRSLRILPILLWVICFLSLAEAQHGGGGHFGGGHSSNAHAGETHAGGRFGWLHFRFGKHSARQAGMASSTSNTSPYLPSRLSSFAMPARKPSIPPTLLWSPQPFLPLGDGRVPFVSLSLRPHRAFLFNRFPRFSSSGCFFNGVTQVCFFEPFLPLLACSGDFGFFDSGFAGDSLDLGDDSQGLVPSEMSAVPPPADPSDEATSEGDSPGRDGAAPRVATEGQDLGKGVLLLVLKNGASHAVVDYWVADGYLEYISSDGIRSHIPLEALDLQRTVTQNAPRGLSFVLRAAPGPR